ncbi:MAG: hypothetical protein JRJ31_17030 [Deltaproteobacteria bacterium]|nr:hypothetical protein [Deltaproteobacteria bacterium]
MDIIRFYDTHHIPYYTHGKNVSPGWVNIQCPMPGCGDHSNHLGFNLKTGAFHCWRCGGHSKVEVICALLKCSKSRALQIIHEFGGRARRPLPGPEPVRRRAFRYPSSTGPLQNRHRRYLERRGFDPDRLEREWGLLGTGPVALLDGKDYKHRIIVPIRYQGKVVSFQGRDITGRSGIRYKACPRDRELVSHQRLLYGIDKAVGGRVVVTEGVTDVWRLGPGAVATFGIAFTDRQITLLTRFDRVFLLFDQEPQAQARAKKLRAELLAEGVRAEILSGVLDGGDPAEMTQDDADNLMKSLMNP